MTERNLTQRLVLRLASELEARAARFGNTHLNKGAYMLKELLGVPVAAAYSIYHYGPFSNDVRSVVSTLVDQHALVYAPRQGGDDARYLVGPMANANVGSQWDAVRHYTQQIAYVADTICRWDRPTLEAVLTALFLRRTFPGWDDADVVIQLQEIKPHITKEFAQAAVRRLNELEAEVSERALRVDQRSALGSASPHLFEMPDDDIGLRRQRTTRHGTRTVLLAAGHDPLARDVRLLLEEAGLRVLGVGLNTADVALRILDGHLAPLIVVAGTRSDLTPPSPVQLQLGQWIEDDPAQELLGVLPVRLRQRTIMVVPPGQQRRRPDVPELEFDGSPDQRASVLQKLEGLGVHVRWDSRWGQGPELDQP